MKNARTIGFGLFAALACTLAFAGGCASDEAATCKEGACSDSAATCSEKSACSEKAASECCASKKAAEGANQ
jgi:hypothetical protein